MPREYCHIEDNRDFHAERPNQKWVTDISYIKTGQGVLYLRSFETSMTIALLHTKPVPNRTSILSSLQSEQPRERKRSPQSCNSTVTRAFSTPHKRIIA